MSNVIDKYIQDQADISAVDRFASQHSRPEFDSRAGGYTELIPRRVPGEGEQLAFEVDLDACTGCKSCVTACHNENGLDPDETWRDVGLVMSQDPNSPDLQHITTACHHCLEPACMDGCPTLAYEKDPVTGIVKHLDDQCFGCQYCILKCPYDVPKYNPKRGVVHKCDMCVERLNENESPACVRSCPNEAIRISIVNKQEVKTNFTDYVNIPDAPPSNHTFPTTRYLSKRKLGSDMIPADSSKTKPQPAHWPLVIMLVLTQLSVGAFAVESILRIVLQRNIDPILSLIHVPFSISIGLLALVSSLLHLGRPHLAYRAILGFRTSWLSREIIIFSCFAFLTILYGLGNFHGFLKPSADIFLNGLSPLDYLGLGVIGVGLLGVYSSVKVYRDTKRPFWNSFLTNLKFFATTAILGGSAFFTISTVVAVIHTDFSYTSFWISFGEDLLIGISIVTVAKILLESGKFFHLAGRQVTYMKKSVLLMVGPLRISTVSRFILSLLGGVGFPLFMTHPYFTQSDLSLILSSFLAFGALLGGELLERYLFFKAVVPTKMPGAK